jgi:methionyl-tRNA formyltransferase
LLQLQANIVGVITKSNSNYNSDFKDLSNIAIDNNIPFKYVNDINHINNIIWIKEKNPDIIFCFGWSNLIKSELLSLSKMGVVGYHPAMLPNNKGRHPLIWAKVLGLEVTGSTFFFMDEGADTGDILDQKQIAISFEDDINDIYFKMTKIALFQIENLYSSLSSNNYLRVKQKELGNTWRKRSTRDGLIDFRMTTNSICNLVRALTKPFPGAHCQLNNLEYKIWKVKPGFFDDKNIEPGKIINFENQILEIKTGDSSVILLEHEIPASVINKYI